MIILGIETSCDETAAAVLEIHYPTNNFCLRSNIITSQIKIHQKYGGIVPEVAARKQIEMMLPVLEKALRKAKIKNPKKQIDIIAVTRGPGLITSLLVGVETARTLSYVWQKPLVAINHLEGHLASVLLKQNRGISKFQFLISRQIPNSKFQIPKIEFPAIALIVSGGHTELVLVKEWLKYKKIGETRDDAAGEAFDKVAKLLGLGYPGGPAIEKIKNQKSKIKNIKKILLPRPMINSDDYDFSFAGLKTAVLYLLQDLKKDKRDITRLIPAIAYEFQEAMVDVLIAKTIKAAREYKVKSIILGGGVAANDELRKQLKEKISKEVHSCRFLVPDLQFCTDNAAMIALAGYLHCLKKDFTPWQKIKADPNLRL